jgi:hypothetical protein
LSRELIEWFMIKGSVSARSSLEPGRSRDTPGMGYFGTSLEKVEMSFSWSYK